jgi:hypothetical protein
VQFIDPKGSFLQNLVLSLLLLGVARLLIPTVLKQIDDRKAIDQERFQEQLSRQDKILDAQAALLATMASDFWEYELYASDVVISRDERFGQDDWHQRAVDAYYLQTGPLLGKMRARSARCYGWPRNRTKSRFCGCTKRRSCLLIPACSN